ncbi:MAG: hypothetical protein JWO48_626 [Bryobacterales bacterium]|nr:hypothetical protein [Bryobacterales bacterium]
MQADAAKSLTVVEIRSDTLGNLLLQITQILTLSSDTA